jgi:hypothetical protein
MAYERYEDEYWDNWNGEICVGCDLPSQVNDLGLCNGCNAKLDRDMIRSRDWDRSTTGFLTPDSELENLRTRIIREYGRGYELIIPPSKAELKAIQSESRQTPTAPGELPNIAPRLMGEYTEAEVVDVLEQILASSPTYIWRELQEVSQILRRYFPDLNPKVFGYKGLRRLVQANPKRFQTMWDDPKKKHKAIILIRLTKDHTQHT